jgi:type III secretion protein L
MGTLLFINQGRFAPPAGARVLQAADYALLLEGEAVLAKAEAEAEETARQARIAYEEERARGYDDGLMEGKMEMAERMIDTVVSGVDYLEGLDATIVDLVMNAMHKVIDGFDDRERVMGLVRKALGYARSQRRVLLRVCPEDAEIVQAEMSTLLRDFPGIGVLDVVTDPRMKKGDCVLESELGLIDAGLDVQMAAIRKAFQTQLKRSAGER